MPDDSLHQSDRSGPPPSKESRAWWRRWPALLGIAAVAVVVVWFLPPLMYRHTDTDAASRLKAVTDTRTALVAGLAGIAALWSVSFTARTFELNRRSLENSREAQLESHRLEREAQLTSLWTKAVDQLGSDNLDVRHGGIYALERIAINSEKDQPAVVEVLSAFVRRHSRETYDEDHRPMTDDDAATRGRREPLGPDTDVQAALTVLGRLPMRAGVSRARLRRAHLEHAWLPDAHLEGADLTNGARLEQANLRGVHLDGADLTGAYLDRADLTRAVLDGANLTGAHLERASLAGASFAGADLSYAHLSSARGLTREQIASAIVDDATELPAGLSGPGVTSQA